MFRHFIYIRSRSPASTNTPSAFPFHHKDKKKDTTLRCVVSPKQSVGNRCWNATNIVSTKTFRFFALQIYKLFLYRSCDLLFFSPLFNNIRIYTIKKGGTTLAMFRPSLSVSPPCCYRASGGLSARRLFFFSTFSGVLSGNAML